MVATLPIDSTVPLWAMILIAAVTGTVSGAIGSLVAPWVQWAVERRRDRVKARRERIAEWRRVVGRASSFDDVVNTSVFAELKKHMKSEDVKSMLSSVWVTVGGGAGVAAGDPKLKRLLAVIDKVEGDWGLL